MGHWRDTFFLHWIKCFATSLLDNVILYWLTENRIETQFTFSMDMCTLQHAQHNLTEFFGASEFLQNQPEKAEEIKVLLESTNQTCNRMGR